MAKERECKSSLEKGEVRIQHMASVSSFTSSCLSLRHHKDRRESQKTRTSETSVKDEDQIFFNDDEENYDIPGFANTSAYLGPHYAQQHAISASRKKIIQEILAKFDLEEVMGRYRGDTVDKSAKRHQFDLYLEDIMRSNKTQLNDREWNEQLRQQVLQDYQRKQEEKERRLAEAESQRILKLKILGFLPDESEERTTGQRDNLKTMSERRFQRRTAKKHELLFRPCGLETQMEILNRDENERRSRRNTLEEREEDDNESRGSYAGKEGQVQDLEDHLTESQEDKKKAPHPKLREFYEEEDLESLYREAERLVRCAPQQN